MTGLSLCQELIAITSSRPGDTTSVIAAFGIIFRRFQVG
jgi:hypothetical protein